MLNWKSWLERGDRSDNYSFTGIYWECKQLHPGSYQDSTTKWDNQEFPKDWLILRLVFTGSQMKCCMLDLSIDYRQLAQTETSPLWALWVRGNDITSLTYFRDLNYTSNRSSCDVWSLGKENLERRQTSSSNQSWATTSSAHNFSNVTKNTTNESPEIQMSPGSTLLWNKQSYIQLFLTGQLCTTAEELLTCWFCLIFGKLLHFKPRI